MALDHFEVTIVGFSVLLDHDRILENLTIGIIGEFFSLVSSSDT